MTIHLTYCHVTTAHSQAEARIEDQAHRDLRVQVVRRQDARSRFPDPITSIVGPNGCGKSNIVDAIRWVMGEQSAKHLRGRAMEDVIFAGSESRGPAGFAEVSLTFDAQRAGADAAPGGVPWGAAAPEEIVVTRRLYRDGSSEYLLNGVPSRLRDVVEFFLGTGVGSKAYAIIEQGRIGFIVSSRPEDRRGLIDEAAGITRYKAKKKAAERRMDSTRQHLLRVSDIIGEIEGRLRSLRLQAQKAERYKRYKAELQGSRSLVVGAALPRPPGRGEVAGRRARRACASSHETESDAAGGRGGGRRGRAPGGHRGGERAGGGEGRSVRAVEQGAARHAARRSTTTPRRPSSPARAEAARKEIDELRARAAAQAADIEEIESRLAEIDAAADASEREYEAQARLQESGGRRWPRRGASWRRRVAEIAAARARIARGGGGAGAAPCSGATISRRALAALAAEDAAAGERLDALVGGGAASCATRSTALRARVDDARAAPRGRATRRGWRRCAPSSARGELELETLREEAHRRRSRLASLTEIQDRYERFQKGVRAIMQEHRAAGGGDGHQGRGRRHRAAAAGARDRRRGGAGRAARQRHRRVARGGRRGDPVPQAAARGAIVVHPARAARARARAARCVYDAIVGTLARRPATPTEGVRSVVDPRRGRRRLAEGRRRARADARAHRLRPAVRRGRRLPARRRAGGRGSRARAGAVARDAHRRRPSSRSTAR